METVPTFTAFAGETCIASGDVREVVRRVKDWTDREDVPVLIFEDRTGSPIDFDLRGTAEEAVERLASHPHVGPLLTSEAKRTGPGRPKLGVVSREVSLLPRHWEWLEQQRGGISVALRSLVDEARKRGGSRALARQAREAAGKLMWTLAGDLPDFEEASRALYQRDDARLRSLTERWPKDIRDHLARRIEEAARLETLAEAEARAASGAAKAAGGSRHESTPKDR
jgi:hypothetical protein